MVLLRLRDKKTPMKQKVDLDFYLKRSEQLKIDPNFFVSSSYFWHFEAECYQSEGWIWVEVEGECLFPPLPVEDAGCPHSLPVTSVWSDFHNLIHPIRQGVASFLDWEYIYDPQRFNDLSGGQWFSFRKNSRKWPNRNPDWTYREPEESDYPEGVLVEWLERHLSNAQDPEIVSSYTLGIPPGVKRKFLFKSKFMVAVNAWDENYRYINYRVCLCRDEPFLSEFARLLFYTDADIQNTGKLVNDGGTLGNPGLEVFKDKLNSKTN
jgi:hypothetical protein